MVAQGGDGEVDVLAERMNVRIVSMRENVRANLRRHGCPPDKREQAEALSEGWGGS